MFTQSQPLTQSVPCDPFYTEGSSSFVYVRAASVAIGRSEPVPRARLATAVDQRLFTADSNQWLILMTVIARAVAGL